VEPAGVAGFAPAPCSAAEAGFGCSLGGCGYAGSGMYIDGGVVSLLTRQVVDLVHTFQTVFPADHLRSLRVCTSVLLVAIVCRILKFGFLVLRRLCWICIDSHI